MKQTLLILSIQFIALFCYAGKITGTITDEKGEPLPFASISIKGTNLGVIAGNKGTYEIVVNPGTYTLVCQHVGYKAESKTVTVSGDLVVNFQLQLQQLKMEEVVIKKGPDPAIEIIRQAIKKREHYNRQVDSFTVDVYIKGLMKTRYVPEMFRRSEEDKKDMEMTGFDSLGRGILFLSESLTKVSYKRPDKFKYEVISSRQAGGGYGINFPIFINFYVNNVQVFTSLNPRGFVSPISDNAFHFYKFRYEGSFFENDNMIHRIRVTPKRKHEPLFDGYLQIVEEDWRIHSLDLLTTKDYQLQLIDTVRIKQIHSPISDDIWRTQNQVVFMAGNFLGFEWTGDFLNVYSNYNLNPGFTKKYFTRTVVTYDTAFNKRDSLYWSGVRPIPLDPEEQKDFVFKDSLYKKIRDSLRTQAGADSMNRNQRPITAGNVLFTGITRRRYSKSGIFTYKLTPLLYAAQYNTVEGLAPAFTHAMQFSPHNSKHIYYLDVHTRYGFSNEHFNASGTFIIKPKQNYLNKFLEVGGGKRVSQFNHDNPIDPFINTSYTLFRKRNYMKIYENWFGEIRYNSSFENGLRWKIQATFEDRIPLENTTDYSFGKKHRIYSPNHPAELEHVPFNRHQALVTTVTLAYQPGQLFIQYPHGKVGIGSKYPVLELEYSKGIADLMGSDVDFDKWKFTVSDKLNLRLGGEFHYKISVGGFLNDKRVEIPDFRHFNGNQIVPAQAYLNGFQLAPYYAYSNTERLYGVMHVEHHFNGLLTNKLPLFNKLKWTLVAGANSFYVNRDNYYVEAFAGIENILKLIRVDFVAGYQALPGNRFGVRLGFGGLLGGAISGMRNK